MGSSADEPLALAESGGCKRQEENAERGINGGNLSLAASDRGATVYAAKVRILFLMRAEGRRP